MRTLAVRDAQERQGAAQTLLDLRDDKSSSKQRAPRLDVDRTGYTTEETGDCDGMADVEMPDASAAPKLKSKQANGGTDMEGKKRFEVKKARRDARDAAATLTHADGFFWC